jgi:hypothetical protein
MTKYLTKYILEDNTIRDVIEETKKTKILPDKDKADEDPTIDDEIYGQLGDESDSPEDPAEEVPLEKPALRYANRNPTGNPCSECARLIGTVWPKGSQPRLPRHSRCYCYYVETWQPADKTTKRFRHKPKNIARSEPKLPHS